MKALLPILALTLLAVSGCTRSQAAASPADPSNAEAAALLERACTTCHDLGGLNAFANSYGESQWRGLIDTMISYGATVSPSEADTLARYLALNYGTGQMVIARSIRWRPSSESLAAWRSRRPSSRALSVWSRASWRERASTTRPPIAAELSPASSFWRSRGGSALTATDRSMRSRSGPDSLEP
jgi:hypothetical protein